MKSKSVPDRVHVVRPPENDSYPPSSGQNIEIIRTLAKISDKLKRSEAERYELLAELREYRKSLRDLEDKSDSSEKLFLNVENRLKSSGSTDTEVLQRQVRFEKSLKATEDKMLKAIAGQAVMDKRLRDTEDKQTMIDQRLDQSLSEQIKLSRQMDIISQDKIRLMRKVDRLEEIVTETQNSLRAKAMVLLTNQSQPPSQLSAPAWDNVKAEIKADAKSDIPKATPRKEDIMADTDSRWGKYINIQSVSTLALVCSALLLGWAINQMRKPDVVVATTQSNIPNNSSLSDNNDVSNIQKASMTTVKPVPDDVLDYSDDQLLDALNADPDALAAQLNNIEPGGVTPDANVNEGATTPAIIDPKITPEMKNFEAIAFIQDPKIQQQVLSEKRTLPLNDVMQPDPTLKGDAKKFETLAFKGNGEAQHNLAAMYTAGHDGVQQNFDKAAFWFREASDNGIANARYNLGVLYHQGLGEERNITRALYWYREAAKLGHAEAQYNLGIAHIEGIGTEYNPQMAATYFERAANNGIMEAAYNLGLIYDNGLLGQTKPDEALLWYKIAADQGSAEAKTAMQQLAKNLQIGMDDIDNLVDRMQLINESVKGRRAGPSKSVRGDVNKASSLKVDEDLVTQIQEYLMLTGAYAGPADGVNGQSTQDSIRAYQAANNLPVDGEITEDLLKSMIGGAQERLNKTN